MIVISRSLCRLFYLPWGSIPKIYRVSVGATESPIQRGLFKIIERWLYPSYRTKDGTIYKGSKNNWTGIGPVLFILANLKGEKIKHSIHGFVDNWKYRQSYVKSHTINYTQESSGCVRMNNNNILDLEKSVKMGELVVII